MATFEKYAWLNKAPDWIIDNLRARVAAISQPGDAAAFARLRGARDATAATVPAKPAQTRRGGNKSKPARSAEG